MLLISSLFWAVPASAADADLSIPQGAVARFAVSIQAGDSAPWGSFRGALVHFKATGEQHFTALVGVDMECPVGEHPFEVKVLRNSEATVIGRPIVQVVDAGFGVQHLILPDKMVTLDDATLKRVKTEKAEVGALWRHVEKQIAWELLWALPVDGKVGGSFGKRRVINGEPRQPHNGEDISAPLGTVVRAPTPGIARLAKARYFGGQTVFLEHGGGVFTFYMHLSEISVKDGDQVAQGDAIGKVGASGRATGPHLHWGGRINNARINPLTLTRDGAPFVIESR